MHDIMTDASDKVAGVDRHDELLERLHEIFVLARATSNRDTIINAVLQRARGLLDGEASSLMLIDRDGQTLYFSHATGPLDPAAAQTPIPIDGSIAGLAVRRQQCVVVSRSGERPGHFNEIDRLTGIRTQTLVAAPLQRRSRVVGVMEVINKANGADFSRRDAQLLHLFAEHAALMMENLRLLDEQTRMEYLARLGASTANIAHNLKNIIGQMQGSLCLMQKGMDRDNARLQRSAWPLVRRSCEKLARVAREILFIACPRSLEKKSIDVNSLIRDLVQRLVPAEDGRAVVVSVELDPDLPRIQADPEKIHEVLLNLVMNACEAIEQGAARDGRVVIRSMPEPGVEAIRLDVVDNGPGIPPELRRRVFEPFFSTKGSQGTGLGLPMVEKIIEQHGGRFTLQSRPYEETVFSILLPVAGG